MECNKEEAIKAKQIAEMRMQTGDFAGAKRMVQKAQQLDPELQNIPQMLMVCEVHCSAQTKLNGLEMDWYGILQVEQFSDDANIKKQYRRLALALHPDKNKFPGAEAAFKLIGEANSLLADPAKRSTYDMKFRELLAPTILKPAPHQSYRSSQVPKHGAANIFSETSYSQKTSSRPHQQPDLTTFWTCCSNCKMGFKFYKIFRNRKLTCRSCRQSFIAHDLGFEPPISSWIQFNNQKEAQNQGSTKVATQSNLPKPCFVAPDPDSSACPTRVASASSPASVHAPSVPASTSCPTVEPPSATPITQQKVGQKRPQAPHSTENKRSRPRPRPRPQVAAPSGVHPSGPVAHTNYFFPCSVPYHQPPVMSQDAEALRYWAAMQFNPSYHYYGYNYNHMPFQRPWP